MPGDQGTLVILRDRWLRATTGVREHLASLTETALKGVSKPEKMQLAKHYA